MYLAKCYTRINGKMYMRGDEVPNDLPEDKVKWLLEAGAIKEFAPEKLQQEKPAEKPEVVPEEVQEETGSEAEAPQEEADDEAEAPEIDVMAGIVQGETEEEPEKPARIKSAAKKQTGRRKSG